MATYCIQSIQTEYCLFSNGKESDGSDVTAIAKDEYEIEPDAAIVIIEPPLDDSDPVTAIMRNPQVSDLYVGYKEVDGGKFLAWTEEKFEWIVNPTGDSEFNIIPADGEDLYWFDKFNAGIYRRVALRPGREIQEQENSFRIELV